MPYLECEGIPLDLLLDVLKHGLRLPQPGRELQKKRVLRYHMHRLLTVGMNGSGGGAPLFPEPSVIIT